MVVVVRANRGGRFLHGHPAQALVELALILPLLTMLFLGAIDLTRAFYTYIVLENATREAARLAIDYPNQYTDTYICAAATREAQGFVTLSCSGGSPNVTVSPAANAGATPPTRESGHSAVKITATSTFQPVTIFIEWFTGSSITVTASTTMLTYY